MLIIACKNDVAMATHCKCASTNCYKDGTCTGGTHCTYPYPGKTFSPILIQLIK